MIEKIAKGFKVAVVVNKNWTKKYRRFRGTCSHNATLFIAWNRNVHVTKIKSFINAKNDCPVQQRFLMSNICSSLYRMIVGVLFFYL